MGQGDGAQLDLRRLAELRTSSVFALAVKETRNVPESVRTHVRNVIKIPLVAATVPIAAALVNVPLSGTTIVLGAIAAGPQVDRCIQGHYAWQYLIRVNRPKLVRRVSSMQNAFRGRYEEHQAGTNPKGSLKSLGFRVGHKVARHTLNGAVLILDREPDWSRKTLEDTTNALHPPLQPYQRQSSHRPLSFPSRVLR